MFHERPMDRRIFDILYIRSRNQLDTNHLQLNKIISAANNGTIVIFKSYVGEPIGYLIFAKINSNTFEMIKMNFGEIAYPHEWNSGRIVFIVDCVISKSQSQFSRKQILDYLKTLKIYAFFKKGTIKLIYKGRISKKYSLPKVR